jgi:ATP phosphoribosyltransferase
MSLTLAIPTGRLGKQVLDILQEKSLLDESIKPTRKLDVTDTITNFRYLFVKPSDVLTYVEKGVADIGIVGKDTIMESDSSVYELLDLGLGKCDMIIAGLNAEQYETKDRLRVASKYTNIAKRYFESINRDVEITKLNGSVELAPLVGLSDVIVDITETGETLKANGLMIFESIMQVSARLVANTVSYKFKKIVIDDLIKSLE